MLARGEGSCTPTCLQVEMTEGEGAVVPAPGAWKGLPLPPLHLHSQSSSLGSWLSLPLCLHSWEGAVFSSRLKVVERGCTGSSQRVAVGGAQFLSHRRNCGLSGPRVA